jgi:hypothetical protein
MPTRAATEILQLRKANAKLSNDVQFLQGCQQANCARISTLVRDNDQLRDELALAQNEAERLKIEARIQQRKQGAPSG